MVLAWNSARDGVPPKCEPLATMTQPLASEGYASVIADASSFIESALEDVDFEFEEEVADFRVYAEYEYGTWPFCPDDALVRVYLFFTAIATDAAPPLPMNTPACTTPPRPETAAPATRGSVGRAAFLLCLVGTASHSLGLPLGGSIVRHAHCSHPQDARTGERVHTKSKTGGARTSMTYECGMVMQHLNGWLHRSMVAADRNGGDHYWDQEARDEPFSNPTPLLTCTSTPPPDFLWPPLCLVRRGSGGRCGA